MFANPFSFNGRIRRMEYAISYFFFSLVIACGNLESGDVFGQVISVVLMLICLWCLIAQGTKRCHDLGKSGWYQLVPGFIILMFFGRGFLSYNQYRPNPKGIQTIQPE